MPKKNPAPKAPWEFTFCTELQKQHGVGSKINMRGREVADISGHTMIVGVDEVGLGPIAGPVYVCAVRVPVSWDLPWLTDSKKLGPEKCLLRHEELVNAITAAGGSYQVESRQSNEIDKVGIQAALEDAMGEAVSLIAVVGDLTIVDGNKLPACLDGIGLDLHALVKADGFVPAVSAASVIAKARRDTAMGLISATHLNKYGFEQNSGYPTPAHLKALREHGPSPWHRRSYGPVAEECKRRGIV